MWAAFSSAGNLPSLCREKTKPQESLRPAGHTGRAFFEMEQWINCPIPRAGMGRLGREGAFSIISLSKSISNKYLIPGRYLGFPPGRIKISTNRNVAICTIHFLFICCYTPKTCRKPLSSLTNAAYIGMLMSGIRPVAPSAMPFLFFGGRISRKRVNTYGIF